MVTTPIKPWLTVFKPANKKRMITTTHQYDKRSIRLNFDESTESYWDKWEVGLWDKDKGRQKAED
jgi:hypothetical protein